MKPTTIIGAAALLSALTGSNLAAAMEDVSGALLKNICTSYVVDRPASTLQGMCFGYVVGVMSVVAYTNYFCKPVKSTHSQATLVVKKYLLEHPEKLHLNADGLVLEALIEAFPCPGSSAD